MAETIEVVEATSASASLKLAAATLQGRINAGAKARIYLISARWCAFWLDRLLEKGYARAARRLSLDEFFDLHRDAFDTVIVTDPDVSATVNVATMMASLGRAIVCQPEDLDRFRAGKRVEDLRGRWRANAEAYEWAFAELWPRMSRVAVAHTRPSLPHLRDYLVQQRIFCAWVGDPAAGDNPESARGREIQFLERLLAAAPPNIPILGFWGGRDGLPEYRGVGLAGEYGKLTLATDFGPNMSLLSGVKTRLDDAVKAYGARLANRPPPLERDKVYVCYDITESGDSPAYYQNRQHLVWSDPARGAIPINWSICPAGWDLQPSVMEWFYEQATPNDSFYVALSGIGYCHPFRALMARVDNPEEAWAAYLRLTADGMRRAGAREIGLYFEANRPYERALHDPIARRYVDAIPGLDGLVIGMHRSRDANPDESTYLLDSTLVSHVMTHWPQNYQSLSREELIQWQVNEIQSQTPRRRPGFMRVMSLSWAYGPSEILEVHRRLGPGYAALNPREFQALARAAISGPRGPDSIQEATSGAGTE